MNWLLNVFLILIFTFIVSVISYYVFKVKGPWENFWVKTLLLFLFVLAASLWIKPIGPEWYGVKWLVLFIGALLFILLLAAFSPSSDDSPKIPTNLSLIQQKRLLHEYTDERRRVLFSLGMMFWLLLIVLIVIVVVGYYLS